MRFVAAAIIAISVGWFVVSLWRDTSDSNHSLATGRPVELPADGYVTSRRCQSCHTQQFETWHASFHRTMTQPATPETVFGLFDDVQIEDRGRVFRLNRREDQFFVEMDDPQEGATAKRIERQIVMVTGSHHMQVYWYPTGKQRTLGQFPLVYLIDEERWIPRRAAFLTPPAKPFHSETGRWNSSCCRCHTTHPRRRPITNSTAWDTQVAEFGIACEACHGPGERHVRAMNVAQRINGVKDRRQRETFIVQPQKLSAKRSSQVCGQCHGMYFFAYRKLEDRDDELQNGFRYRPGGDLKTDGYRHIVQYKPGTRQPVLQNKLNSDPHFIEDRFWPDGTVRVSGREFNGLIESPCYQRGELSCLSCHSMHQPADDPRPLAHWANDQLQLGMDGDRACLKCHASHADRISQHTHHQPNSTGSRCYNCHMPHTTYGLLKAMRSHRIESPSLATNLRTRRPNACNLCHLDKPLGWTALQLNRWYGHDVPKLSHEQNTIAASVLWSLSGDAAQRALLVWSMGWKPAQKASGTSWLPPLLAARLEDPYDAVRLMAYRSLRGLRGFESFQYDFLGSQKQRHAAMQKALQIWNKTVPPIKRATGDAILIAPNGTLRKDEFDRLTNERDDRRIDLQE